MAGTATIMARMGTSSEGILRTRLDMQPVFPLISRTLDPVSD
jgi:hypothetical protein